MATALAQVTSDPKGGETVTSQIFSALFLFKQIVPASKFYY